MIDIVQHLHEEADRIARGVAGITEGNDSLIAAAAAEIEQIRFALAQVDASAPATEPPPKPTSRDADDAVHEGYMRGWWEAALASRKQRNVAPKPPAGNETVENGDSNAVSQVRE